MKKKQERSVIFKGVNRKKKVLKREKSVVVLSGAHRETDITALTHSLL